MCLSVLGVYLVLAAKLLNRICRVLYSISVFKGPPPGPGLSIAQLTKFCVCSHQHSAQKTFLLVCAYGETPCESGAFQCRGGGWSFNFSYPLPLCYRQNLF